MNWIEHFVAPKRLYLAWQAPDQLGDRFRWAVGELAINGDGDVSSLRYFAPGEEFHVLNQGRDFDQLKALGYGGYPAFGLKHTVHRDGVSDAFMRRLPPLSRPDFGAYRTQFRIGSPVRITQGTLLAVTEAKLPSDGFSVVDPLDGGATLYDLMLEVAGYRYYAERVGSLMKPGHTVTIIDEPHNPYDPNAVQFVVDSQKVGNVNRLQAPAFKRWLSGSSVTATVERMNGRPDHPRAFIFVRVRPAHQAAA